MTVLSGWNLPFPVGTVVTVMVTQTEIRVTPLNPRRPVTAYKISDLLDIQIGGAGARVRRSWRMWSFTDGNPFNVARSMLAQGLFNELTSRLVIDTEVNCPGRRHGAT